MARRLYVYYRVPSAALAGCVQAALALQAGWVQACPGLCAELLRRPGLRDGEVTLMEAYSGPAQALAETLPDALAQAAALAGLPGARHAEWFDELEPHRHDPS